MDHRHSLPERSNTALAAPLCRVPARPSGYLSPARVGTPDPLGWAPLIRSDGYHTPARVGTPDPSHSYNGIREARTQRYERFEQGGSKRSNAALKLNPTPASIPFIHLPLLVIFSIIKGCG